MVIDLQINGAPEILHFALDTGALNIVDTDVARRLQLESQGSAIVRDSTNHQAVAPLVVLQRIDIGKQIALQNMGAGVADVSALFKKHTGKHVDGILGSNALRHFTIELDYQSSYLVFSHKNADEFHRGADIDVPMDQIFSNGFAPAVDCKVNNVHTACIIDTGGAFFFFAPPEFFSSDSKDASTRCTSISGISSTGMVGSREGGKLCLLESLIIGKKEFTNIPATTSNLDSVYIGAYLLFDFQIILDYPGNRALFFSKSRHGSDYSRMLSPGFDIELNDKNEVVVRNVVHGSMAALYLKPKDRILSINGWRTNATNLNQVLKLLSHSRSDSIQVVYSPGIGARRVTLKKQSMAEMLGKK